MTRFKQEFLEEKSADEGLGYLDGFRFGFGFFTAWLLGLVLTGVVIMIALAIVRR